MLRRRVGGRSMREACKEIPCSAPYLWRVLQGKKPMSAVILAYLGLEKQITYRRQK